jgi:hypothetical protein
MPLWIGAVVLLASEYPFCDRDGLCEWPESCSTCTTDCGSCGVESLTHQRAKFVDNGCEHAGTGLVDRCATSEGGDGRFNDLQVALSSLRAGDTLFVHSGDYWRVPTDADERVFFLTAANSGTPGAPVVVTAADPANPPVLHTFDPSGGSRAAAFAFGTHQESYVDHAVVDHLRLFQGIGNSADMAIGLHEHHVVRCSGMLP